MIRVVWSGIDTWEESFTGELEEEVVKNLEEKKKQAQDDELWAPYQIGRRVFHVGPTGLRPWRYLLKSEDMQLRLYTTSFAPALSARLRPLGLVRLGHEKLCGELRELATALKLESSGVSRVDVAVDFQGWAPTVADMQNVICNASYRPIYPNLENPESFYFGKGGLAVRIYNKSKEMAVSHKEWMGAVWQEAPGYELQEDVWRFEVQIRRAELKRLGCQNAATVLSRLPEILGFALDWCNLRVATGENKARWPEDARWRELRKAACAGEPAKRAKDVHMVASYGRAAQTVYSSLLSAAAWVGETDLDEMWRLLRKDVECKIAESEKDFAALVGERQRRQASAS